MLEALARSAARTGVGLAVMTLSPDGEAAPPRASAPPRVDVFVHDASGLPSCPNAQRLSERINASVDEELFDARDQRSERVFVSFAAIRGGVSAQVSTARSGDEPRELFEASEDCARLTDAVVLTATLLLTPAEPNSSDESHLPGKTPSTMALSPAASAPLVSAAPREDPARHERRSALGATLIATSGALPELQWGVGLQGGSVLAGRLWLRGGAEYLPVVQISRAGQAYRFSRSSAWMGVGWSLWLTPRFSLDAQGAATLGITHVAVLGDSGVDPGDFAFPGFRGGMSGSFAPTPALLAVVGVHGEMPIVRNVFRSENVSDPIWSQPWVGFSAEVGLAWRSW